MRKLKYKMLFSHDNTTKDKKLNTTKIFNVFYIKTIFANFTVSKDPSELLIYFPRLIDTGRATKKAELQWLLPSSSSLSSLIFVPCLLCAGYCAKKLMWFISFSVHEGKSADSVIIGKKEREWQDHDSNSRAGQAGRGGSFQHFGRQRWVDHLRSGVQDQPGQHGETLSLPKIQKLGWRGCSACNPSYSRGWAGRIA